MQADHIPPAGSNPVPPFNRLAERVRQYIDQHPEVSLEQFLLGAVRREIRLREQRETGHESRPVRREVEPTSRWSTARRLPTVEDIRLHAWLTERLAVLDHARQGLWPRLRRFLFGRESDRSYD